MEAKIRSPSLCKNTLAGAGDVAKKSRVLFLRLICQAQWYLVCIHICFLALLLDNAHHTSGLRNKLLGIGYCIKHFIIEFFVICHTSTSFEIIPAASVVWY